MVLIYQVEKVQNMNAFKRIYFVIFFSELHYLTVHCIYKYIN